MKVPLYYYAWFGPGDCSEYLDWEIELTPEEEAAYRQAIKDEVEFEDVVELEGALARATREIEEEEGEIEGELCVKFADPEIEDED